MYAQLPMSFWTVSRANQPSCGRWISAIAAALIVAVCGRATSVVPPSFDELVNESDYIVRAVTKSVVAEWRTMPSGKRMIYSKVELEVRETIAGKPPSPLVLEVIGGVVEGRELAISGAPKFVVGEEAILFVQGNHRQIFPLVRIMHGQYPIRRDPVAGREYVARSNGEPLRDVRAVSRAMHGTGGVAASPQEAARPPMSPADFVQSIRATAVRPHLLER